MAYNYILFDLDGTLTDPSEGITNSVMHALKKYGIEESDRSALYKFIGPPLLTSFREFYGFSEEARQKKRLNFTASVSGIRAFLRTRCMRESRSC